MSEFPSIQPSPRRALIEGGIRTAVAAIPGLGGALIEGWANYTSYQESSRIAEFFALLKERLDDLRKAHGELKAITDGLAGASEILERAVEASTREAGAAKRALYSTAYANFIAAPGATTFDERLGIIQDIEQLSENDLNTLLRFRRGHAASGATLTNTGVFGGMILGGKPVHWLVTYGPLHRSLAMLVARGLLFETFVNEAFSTEGNEDPAFTRFRRNAWQITPMGHKLLNSISLPNTAARTSPSPRG